ncbi:hypothetical protein LMH66_07750 [Shewanella sp. 10N.7]|uniref:hypothetical protein n=1 Tax=Shewanella sp. 10N.7 TaxID=2885093 RepID=UPI001E5AE3C1|nr:hypothetical protein [Shewanella sp. 10N.7]MCC4832523.1 hypothetical protein [Shewanella sp. 10N.7]
MKWGGVRVSVINQLALLSEQLGALSESYDKQRPSRELIEPYEAVLVQLDSIYLQLQQGVAASQKLELAEALELYAENISQLACLYRQFYQPHNVVTIAKRIVSLSSIPVLPDCFSHLYLTLLECFSSVHELNSWEFDLEPLSQQMLAFTEAGYQKTPQLWSEAYAWNLATLSFCITEQSRESLQRHYYQQSFSIFEQYNLTIPKIWQQEYLRFL